MNTARKRAVYTRSYLSAVVLWLLTLPASAAVVGPYNELFFFGDSLSDTGNIYNFTSAIPFVPTIPDPADGYAVGRFSNGPVFSDYLSAALGLGPATPISAGAGGNNFAWGGAGVTTPSSAFLPKSSLSGQIDTYLTNLAPGASSLFVVFGGANDVFGALDDGLGAGAVTTAATQLSALISSLVGNGAGHLLIPLLPDISMTPAYLNDSTARQFSQLFNDTLLTGLAPLNADITVFDTFSFIANAGSVFTNMSSACINLSTCDGALFFDDVHPTTRAHQLLADAMVNQLLVPLPAALGLFLSGLMALSVLVYQRNAN